MTFDQILDAGNLAVGFFSGIVVSILVFILTYRSSWRNIITREFTISLRNREAYPASEGGYRAVNVELDLQCSNDEEVAILDAYFKFTKKVEGLTNKYTPVKGKHYFNYGWNLKPAGASVKMHETIRYSFTHSMLKNINNRKLRSLRMVIKTNKYGTMVSNEINFDHLFRTN